MEKEDTIFYLGKNEEPVSEDGQASEEELRISYGGDIPDALLKSDDKWGSRENMERVKVLSEKCERRSRVVSRMIYLERRQMEIITAMTGIGKRQWEKKADFFQVFVFLVFVIICPVLLFVIWMYLRDHLILWMSALVFWIAGLALMKKTRKSSTERKQEELSGKLKEIEEEHELLEKERGELNAEIQRLREQQVSRLEEAE